MHPRPAPAESVAASAAQVPAVVRALRLLERLAERREPQTLARLATDLELPKSSVHGLCNTLLARGYLRRGADGAFALGPRLMSLAEAFVAGIDVAQEFNALWTGARPLPDETVILSVLDGTDVVYLVARNGSRPLGLAFNAGMRLPAHLAATGKSMLAFGEPGTVRRLYGDGPLPRMTGRGAATVGELLDELAEVRQRGYSVDDEGVREGAYCFGAPVFDASGKPVAGIGICVHRSRLGADDGRHHLHVVLEAAATLTRRLGGSAPAPTAREASPARRRHDTLHTATR